MEYHSVHDPDKETCDAAVASLALGEWRPDAIPPAQS